MPRRDRWFRPGVGLGLALLLGLLHASTGQAANYVAGPSGGSGCSTNPDAPSSLTAGIGCLKPGDTLYLRKGTYDVGQGLNNPPGGTDSARVTIAGYPSDGALVVQLNVGGGSGNGVDISSSGSSYLHFDNLIFECSSAGSACFKITGSAHHVRITNSDIRNAGTQGILANAGQEGTPGFNEFINLKVHDNGKDTQFDHGLYIAASDNLIERCDIYNNANFGIHIYNGSGEAARNVVRRNRVHDNGTGVLIGNGDDNVAYNNLIYRNGAGLQIRNGGSNNQGYNNTIWNNSGGDSGGSCVLNVNDNSILRNNICYQNQTNAINGGGRNLTQSNNLFGNPSFVNASGDDFHLQAGSPAIKAGANLSSVFTTDFDGATRPEGPFDLGAYAVGGRPMPMPNTASPSPPRNLRIVNP